MPRAEDVRVPRSAPGSAPRSASRVVVLPVPASGERAGSAAGLEARSPSAARLMGLTRSALLSSGVGTAGAAVAQEYVGAALLSLLVPALVGAGCAWASTRGAARGAGRVPVVVTLGIAMTYAGAGAGLALRLAAPGYGPPGQWLPPVLAAVAGVCVWPLLDPRPR